MAVDMVFLLLLQKAPVFGSTERLKEETPWIGLCEWIDILYLTSVLIDLPVSDTDIYRF